MIRAKDSWFYILANGQVKGWLGLSNCSNDPLVATVSPSVQANPALLHDALPTGDAGLYALKTQYGFWLNTALGYYPDALVPTSRWFFSSVPEASLPIIPFAAPALAAVGSGVWCRNPVPVLTRGASGAWDDFSCYNPRVVKNLDGSPYRDVSGYYYMSYNASNASSQDHDCSGLAKSLSLSSLSWTKVSLTAPTIGCGISSTVDAGDAQVECVLFDGVNFHWWYGANSNTNPALTDQVSIGYAFGPDVTAPVKAGLAVTAIAGEDYYGGHAFRQSDKFGMLATRHVGSVYGIVRLDSSSLAGPWVERAGWAFTHPSNSAFLTNVRVESGNIRILYNDAPLTIPRVALATGTAQNPGSNSFVDAVPLQVGFSNPYSVYGADSVREGGVEHLFYNAQAYTGGVGHATVPVN